MKANILNKVPLLIGVILLTGCLSGLEYKEAQFNRDPDIIRNELKELSDFESANIKWRTSRFGDSTYYSLQVILLNGKGLPSNDSSLYEIGRSAMQIVIKSIDNGSDYDKYVVYFATEKKKGIAKFSSQKPFEYKLNDLK